MATVSKAQQSRSRANGHATDSRRTAEENRRAVMAKCCPPIPANAAVYDALLDDLSSVLGWEEEGVLVDLMLMRVLLRVGAEARQV